MLTKEQLLEQLKAATGKFANISFSSTSDWTSEELFIFGTLLAIANGTEEITQTSIENELASAFGLQSFPFDKRIGSDAYLWDNKNTAILSAITAIGNKLGLLNTSTGSLGYDCFLIVGQSNAEGNGKPPDLKLDFSDPRILNYAPGTEPYSNKLILAEYNLLNIQGQSSNGTQIGYGIQFAKQYLAENPNRRVVLISCALGNTGFSSNHWKVGDNLYTIAVNTVNTFLSQYPESSLKGILWHQGERDHDSNYPINSYQQQLEAMLAGLRSQIAGAAKVPFICGNYSPDWANWSSLKSDMQEVNFQLTRRIPYTGNVLSTGLSGNSGGDVIHFNAASQRELGNRYYTQWKFAKTNVPSVPDTVTNLQVEQYTGTTLKVSYTPDSKTDYVIVNAVLDGEIKSTRTSKFNNLLLTNLIAGSTYIVEAIAVNNVGQSTKSVISGTTNNVSVTVPTNPLIVLDYPANNLGVSTGSIGSGGTGKLTAFNDIKRGAVLRLENQDQGSVVSYNAPATTLPSTTLSFSTFVNLYQYANDLTIFAVDNGTDAGKVIFGIDEVAGLELIVAGVSRIKLPTKFVKNTWQQIGFTIGGGLAKMFIDGLKVAEASVTINIVSNNNPIFIGQRSFNYGCLEGLLDSTIVFQQTLTEQQMAKLFEQTL